MDIREWRKRMEKVVCGVNRSDGRFQFAKIRQDFIKRVRELNGFY